MIFPTLDAMCDAVVSKEFQYDNRPPLDPMHVNFYKGGEVRGAVSTRAYVKTSNRAGWAPTVTG